MEGLEDLADMAPESPFCDYCTDDGGQLLSAHQLLEHFTRWMMHRAGLKEDLAREEAVLYMRKMPIWQGRV